MCGLSMTCRRSAWKRVCLIEQHEVEERRDLRDERSLDVGVMVERGEVLPHEAEVFAERREVLQGAALTSA